jgi:WD40 repeat protein
MPPHLPISKSNDHKVKLSKKKYSICKFFPLININSKRSDNVCKPASVLYKKGKHHYGSIYCTAWNPTGNLIATGSNDKTIKLVKFSPDLAEDNGMAYFILCPKLEKVVDINFK